MDETTTQRKVILYMSMSLDGYAARPDGSMGAAARSTAARPARRPQPPAETWLAELPSATGELMNALPKTIFSSTLTDVEWDNARVTDRPAEDEIADLKREAGKDVVVFGGASFARSLAGLDLIDEYRINVHPFALGDGLPLLPDSLRLELVCSTAWADGPITHTYVSR